MRKAANWAHSSSVSVLLEEDFCASCLLPVLSHRILEGWHKTCDLIKLIHFSCLLRIFLSETGFFLNASACL